MKTNYKIIDDPYMVKFYKKCTTRRYKNITGIKFPIIGKNRGKMLVPEGLWGKVAIAYLQVGGRMLPGKAKIDAKYVEA